MNITPKQAEMIEAVKKYGSARKAAKALGLNQSTVTEHIRRAAKKDPTLHQKTAPPGYHLRGVSTLLNARGEPTQTWVKTANDRVDPEAFLDAFKAAVKDSGLPARRSAKVPEKTAKETLTVYPMGDPHFGMLAWGPESGQDFDLKIAEKRLFCAVDRLVDLAPPSHKAAIFNLGDFFHADSAAGTTTAGTRVDVDSRWAKVLQIGVATICRCIDRALEKHKQVRVINEIGNHDTNASVMLGVCLAAHYRNTNRVQIDTSPSPYHYLEFGNCLLGVHHGNGAKAESLPGVMAVDQREAWGRTEHRYWYCGHVHHESKKEYPGCIVETFRTLAPKDAWHNGKGYRSGQSMVCDVMHSERGRILRHEVGIER